VSIALENRSDWILLLIFELLINNNNGAAWADCTVAFGNVFTSSQIGSVFTFRLIGNIISTIIILPPGLRYGSPNIQKTMFFIQNYWD
jgi:hypothetical protein